MPEITFIHRDGRKTKINASENSSIMHAALENNISEIEGACGGSLACATCHCYIHPDWVKRIEAEDNEKSEEEEDMLDIAYDVRETSRLGCQIKITKAHNGLIIALPGANTGWE